MYNLWLLNVQISLNLVLLYKFKFSTDHVVNR